MPTHEMYDLQVNQGATKMRGERSQVSVPVDTATFVILAQFLEQTGSDKDPVDVVTEAIEYWMDNASWKPEFLQSIRTNEGFQWKNLFLPNGTKIRMKYKNAYHSAEIVGDLFLSDGKSTSPSQFANAVANSARNAWRDLEVRRPADRKWLGADGLRGGKE